MEKNEKIILAPFTSYFMGYYIQDFDKPQTFVNDKTGETTEIDLHQIVVQLLGPIDPDKWGTKYFGGYGVSMIKIPLNSAFAVFGKPADKFDPVAECNALIGKPIDLKYAVNSKNKPVLRGIIPLD